MCLAAFDFLTRNDWFLISLSLLVMSYFLYRPRRIAARAEKKGYALNSIRETCDENARETARSANRAEVKLFEYEREVSGRMQTRLAVLDHLIQESEQKIEMLQRVLEQSRQAAAPPSVERTRGEIQIFENATAGKVEESSLPRSDAA